MTSPTDKELDAAVGNATQLHEYSTSSFTSPYGCHKDWNALMAAVARLEECEAPPEQKVHFYRDFGTWKVWDLSTGNPIRIESFDEQPETRALALCIYSVVNQ